MFDGEDVRGSGGVAGKVAPLPADLEARLELVTPVEEGDPESGFQVRVGVAIPVPCSLGVADGHFQRRTGEEAFGQDPPEAQKEAPPLFGGAAGIDLVPRAREGQACPAPAGVEVPGPRLPVHRPIRGEPGARAEEGVAVVEGASPEGHRRCGSAGKVRFPPRGGAPDRKQEAAGEERGATRIGAVGPLPIEGAAVELDPSALAPERSHRADVPAAGKLETACRDRPIPEVGEPHVPLPLEVEGDGLLPHPEAGPDPRSGSAATELDPGIPELGRTGEVGEEPEANPPLEELAGEVETGPAQEEALAVLEGILPAVLPDRLDEDAQAHFFRRRRDLGGELTLEGERGEPRKEDEGHPEKGAATTGIALKAGAARWGPGGPRGGDSGHGSGGAGKGTGGLPAPQ